MQEAAALNLIRAFPGRPQLAAFAARLLDWLNTCLLYTSDAADE